MPDYLLLASAVPAVQIPTTVLVPRSDYPPVSPQLALGVERSELIPRFNDTGLRSDVGHRACGGPCGVVTGLTLTAGSGLSLNIAAGYAQADGIVYRSVTTAVMTDASRNFVWLNQAGAVLVRTTTTAPAGSCAYIGNVLTAGGVITSLDLSGVVFLGGVPFRRTADAGAPADTPPAGVQFLAKTAGGIYLAAAGDYTQIA